MICVRKMFIWLAIRWARILLRTQPKEFLASVGSLVSIQPNRTSKAWDRRCGSIHPMQCLSMSFTRTPEVSSCWKYRAMECRRHADTSTFIPTTVSVAWYSEWYRPIEIFMTVFTFASINLGKEQPGCALSQEGGTLIPLTLIKDGIEEASRVLLACNHVRAIKLFIDSINGKCPYVGSYQWFLPISHIPVVWGESKILIYPFNLRSPSMSVVSTFFAGPMFQVQHRQLCHYGLSCNTAENRLVQFIRKWGHTVRTSSTATTHRSGDAVTRQILFGHRKRIPILS